MAKGNGKATGISIWTRASGCGIGKKLCLTRRWPRQRRWCASEVEKLKAERDALLDRLARLQAEFDNARKRAVREQQEFANSPRPMSSRTFCRPLTVSSAR